MTSEAGLTKTQESIVAPSSTTEGIMTPGDVSQGGEGVVQIIMRQGDEAEATTTAGQLLQLNTDEGQVQYIQVTNENGEQQLLQLMPDGQAHLVQLSSLENEENQMQLSDAVSTEAGQIQYIEQPPENLQTDGGEVQYTEQLISTQSEGESVHYIQQLPAIQQAVTDTEAVQTNMFTQQKQTEAIPVSQEEKHEVQYLEQPEDSNTQAGQLKMESVSEQDTSDWIKVEQDSSRKVVEPATNRISDTSQLEEKPPDVKSADDIQPVEPATASIDTTKPIELTSETVVVINNKKCVLSVDPNTSALVAYPIKQGPTPGKRPRGRPRKIRTDESQPGAAEAEPVTDMSQEAGVDSSDDKQRCILTEQENSAAEGLLGLSEADGRRKSLRVKKKPKILTDEYEVGAIEGVEDMEDDGALPSVDDKEVVMPAIISASVSPAVTGATALPPGGEKRGRGRPPKVPSTANQVQNFLANLGLPVKRGRGRPRRYPPPGGALNQMPTFIIPSSGGPAVMMAPVQNLDTSKKQIAILPTTSSKSVGTKPGTTETPTPPPIIIQNADGTQTHIVAGPPTDSMVSASTDVSSVAAAATVIKSAEDKEEEDSKAKTIIDEILVDAGSQEHQPQEKEEMDISPVKATVALEHLDYVKPRTVMDTSDIMGQPLPDLPSPDPISVTPDPITASEVSLPEDEESDIAATRIMTKSEDEESMTLMETSADDLAPTEERVKTDAEVTNNYNDDTDSMDDSIATDLGEISKQTDSPEETVTSSASTSSGPATIIQVPSNLMPYLFKKKNDDPVKIGLKQTDKELEMLKCLKCGHQSYYNQQYQDHITETHPGEATKCKCCFFHCFDEETMIKHFKECHPKCICNECNFMAEHGYVIKRHMMRHTARGCKCTICGKVYKDRYILKMHVKMVHMPAEVLFECNTCGKKFTRKAHLKRHLRIHEPEKPFKCPDCDYRGCERSDITKHVVIHEEPKYSCEVCGKFFRHIKNKELHLKRHKGQRDYKCGMCEFYGYTFTDIRKHIDRKHASARLVCDKCGRICRSEALLADHIRSCKGSLVSMDNTGYSIMDVATAINVEDEEEDDTGATIQIPDSNLDTDEQIVLDGKHRFIRVERLPADNMTVDLSDAHIAEASMNESQMVENQIAVTSSGQVIQTVHPDDLVPSAEIVHLHGNAQIDNAQIITDGATHIQITSTGEFIKVEGERSSLPEGVELVEEAQLPEGAVLVAEGAGLVEEGEGLVESEHLELDAQELPEGMVLVEGVELSEDVQS